MAEPPDAIQRFAYRAQTREGKSISGSIEAGSAGDAQNQLAELGLVVLELRLAEPTRARAVRGTDFVVFNQQLAHLAQAGLPIEQGLRMIARDMRRGRLAATIREVVDELERGVPLADAFDARRGRFPAFYGRLIHAGIRAGNLTGVLFSLGRHLELVRRLREALWQTAAYPVVVILFTFVVLSLFGLLVVPQYELIFANFGTSLPLLTRMLIGTSHAAPYTLGALAVGSLLCLLIWRLLMAAGLGGTIVDQCVLPMPAIGPVLRRNMIARWCDTMRLGVDAGLDLPAAIGTAGEAIGSPALLRDGQAMIRTIEAGGALDERLPAAVVPATVTTAMGLAADRESLVATLETLGGLYEQQAEARLGLIRVLVGPALLVVLGVVVGFTVLAMFLPLANVMTSLM